MTATAGTAYERFVDALAVAGFAPRGRGRQAYARCPAHDDRNPSLSVTAGTDRVLVRCQAGCDTVDIVTVLGLGPGDLFDESRAEAARPAVVATYRYIDEAGALLYEKLRFQPKSFRQRRPDGRGGWTWALGDVRRVLYALPALVATIQAGHTVWLVEGEKDAHALKHWFNSIGDQSGVTTWSDGAWQPGTKPKWRPEYTAALSGAHIVIVRDKDAAGAHSTGDIGEALAPVAASVEIQQPRAGHDVHDHLSSGLGGYDFEDVERLSGGRWV